MGLVSDIQTICGSLTGSPSFYKGEIDLVNMTLGETETWPAVILVTSFGFTPVYNKSGYMTKRYRIPFIIVDKSEMDNTADDQVTAHESCENLFIELIRRIAKDKNSNGRHNFTDVQADGQVTRFHLKPREVQNKAFDIDVDGVVGFITLTPIEDQSDCVS